MSRSSCSASPMTRPAETERTSIFRSVVARSRAASSRSRSSRSTAPVGWGIVPSSILVSKRRSSTSRWRRASSSSTTSASSPTAVRSGWARATSANWRIAATGERSSWEASETNRRARCCPASSRSSIRFIVPARREISSSPGGSGTLRWRSRVEIASTSALMASTGDKALAATSQVTSPTTSKRSGMITASAIVSVLRPSTTVSRFLPTITVSMSPDPWTSLATRRNGSSNGSTSGGFWAGTVKVAPGTEPVRWSPSPRRWGRTPGRRRHHPRSG